MDGSNTSTRQESAVQTPEESETVTDKLKLTANMEHPEGYTGDNTGGLEKSYDPGERTAGDAYQKNKFDGKDESDVRKSYHELERKLGERSDEIATLRRIVDKGILTKLEDSLDVEHINEKSLGGNSNTADETETMLSDEQIADELLNNPHNAVSEIKRQVMTEVLDKINMATTKGRAEMKLAERHTDKDKIINSGEFQNWLKSNISHELARISDAQEIKGNPEVLGFILDVYKRSNSKPENSPKISSATLATPVPGMASSLSISKRIFTREELAKMSPEEYSRNNDFIVRAYAEGRVK